MSEEFFKQFDGKDIKVVGPFWRADVCIIKLHDPKSNSFPDSLGLRSLFVTRARVGDLSLLLPGTVLVLCHVAAVQLNLNRVGPDGKGGDAPVLAWKNKAQPLHGDVRVKTVREALRAGRVSLLLLGARPGDWSAKDDANAPVFTCLAGEMPLLFNDGDAQDQKFLDGLYGALSLERAPLSGRRDEQGGDENVGGVRLPSVVSVHASGLSLYGRLSLPSATDADKTSFPWQRKSERLNAPFLLSRERPDPPPLPNEPAIVRPSFRLAVESERLTTTERQRLKSIWDELRGLLDASSPAEGRAPRFATLQIVNEVPRSFWRLRPNAAGKLPAELELEDSEVSVTLSDQALFDQKAPPSSVASFVASAKFKPSGKDLMIELTAKSDKADGQTGGKEKDGPSLKYQADRDASDPKRPKWNEAFTLKNTPCAYSPVETPRRLRREQNLPVPDWQRPDKKDGKVVSKHPLADPLLWAFMPLADGWAQLPVPNLTEQIYLDADLAHLPGHDGNGVAEEPADSQDQRQPLLRGAVSYGNDAPEHVKAKEFESEHAWSLTLRDALSVEGTWTLTASGGSLTLTHAALELFKPEVVVNGLCWFSSGQPTAADALPNLNDWVGGLYSVSLKSVASDDLFPPLVSVQVENLRLSLRDTSEAGRPRPLSAEIGQLELQFRVEVNLLAKLRDAGVWPEGEANALGPDLPLVWRRHPTLPMIQAMPLTQSQTPPSYPSQSRQLVPFELPPDSWDFGAGPAGPQPTAAKVNGARDWLVSRAVRGPAAGWASQSDLPLVSLSLPGFELDPKADENTLSAPEDFPLPRYRHDLPYLDELNALAQLPKVTHPAGDLAPGPDEPPPQPPRALQREDFGRHWEKLSQQATLAAADAVNALRVEVSGDDTTQVVVENLIEPLVWPVAAVLSVDEYPGSLTLNKGQATGLELKGETALRGIFGSFADDVEGRLKRVGNDPVAGPPSAYAVEAGSMRARTADGSEYRDQRGLFRSGSTFDPKSPFESPWLRTAVHLQRGGGKVYELTTARSAVRLLTDGKDSWELWFRDLPVEKSSRAFARGLPAPTPGSDSDPSVNDPEALSALRNFRSGHEWRLGVGGGGEPPHLPLFGLEFFPLTLETVAWHADSEHVRVVEIIGRLQLPLKRADGKPVGEQGDIANTIRVTFESSAADKPLALTGVRAVGGRGEWPLELRQDERADEPSAAPRLRWGNFTLDTTDEHQHALVLTEPSLRFFLFGEDWEVVFSGKELRFPTPVEITKDFKQPGGSPPPAPAGGAVAPSLLKLKLDMADGKHWATLELDARLKDSFKAGFEFDLTGKNAGGPRALPTRGSLFDDKLTLKFEVDEKGLKPPFVFAPFAFQFRWEKYENSLGLQLLPGLYLVEGDALAPGFATLSFGLKPGEVQPGKDLIPGFKLQAGFLETLLECRRDDLLQDDLRQETQKDQNGLGREVKKESVYSSSAYRLSVGYTVEFSAALQAPAPPAQVAAGWNEVLLLNGFLELKNLISWPAALIRDERRGRVVLPALLPPAGKPPLDHLRHTARVLFNQHELPVAGLLKPAGKGDEDKDLLFRFEGGTAWQFIAIVEHQLARIYDGDPPRVDAERRWVSVQELRLLTPEKLAGFLQGLTGVDLPNPADDGKQQEQRTLAGYYHRGLRPRLIKALTEAASRKRQLLVEASATHLIAREPLDGDGARTPLQFLPVGSQSAVLSTPADYGPADPRALGWVLSQVPFLGRLQRREDDAVAGKGLGFELQLDPVLRLKHGRESGAGAQAMFEQLALALALASWGFDKEDARRGHVILGVAAPDWAEARAAARLDQGSLAEDWFRLQHPVREPRTVGVRSVVAALPNSPARLSRSAALQQALLSGRPFNPPRSLEDFLPAPVGPGDDIVWREGSLLAQQGVTAVKHDDQRPPYAWVVAGLQALPAAAAPLHVAISPDGRLVAAAGRGGFIRVFFEADKKAVSLTLPVVGEVQRVVFNDSGKLLAAAGDGRALVWGVTDSGNGFEFMPPREFNHGGLVNDVAFFKDQLLATAGDDQTVKVWNITDGKPARPPLSHDNDIPEEQKGEFYRAAFSPDGKFLAAVGANERGQLLNMATGKKTEFKHANQINSVAFSEDGNIFVTASASNAARTWDTDGAKSRRHFEHSKDDQGGDVLVASLSREAQLVVTASADGTARVWNENEDNEQKQPVGTPLAHGGRVNFAAFVERDGEKSCVVTASNDGTARLWQVEGSMELKRFGHGGAVSSLALARDGRRFATASADGHVRLWSVDDSTKPLWDFSFAEAATRVPRHAAATLIPSPLDADVFLFSLPADFKVLQDDKKSVTQELLKKFETSGFGLPGKLKAKELTADAEWLITDAGSEPQLAFRLVVEESQLDTGRRQINVYRVAQWQEGGKTKRLASLPQGDVPLAFAVSPYAAVEFGAALPRDAYDEPLITSVELLCLDPLTGALRPVANLLEDLTQQPAPDAAAAASARLIWARETHSRLSPESPVAVLRLREIRRKKSGQTDESPDLITTFSFNLVPGIQTTQRAARRGFQLRTAVGELRFREGQFGGTLMPPKQLHTFELAPPQVTGVQPIYELTRPPRTGGPEWPWGISALRMSLRFTDREQDTQSPQGVVGTHVEQEADSPQGESEPRSPLKGAATIWWQVVQNFVQYRSTGARPASGLPPLFRARAIGSLLPRQPKPPLPAAAEITLPLPSDGKPAAEPISRWQPVLPGHMSLLVSNARPGVFYAMYNHLLRQDHSVNENGEQLAATVLGSGSVPVQHRTPRPVPLPPNSNPAAEPDLEKARRDRAFSLRTWASFFEPTKNLFVSGQPADEAFFAVTADKAGAEVAPNRGLRLELQQLALAPDPTRPGEVRPAELVNGGVTAGWDGTLQFAVLALRDASTKDGIEWDILLDLIDGSQTFAYDEKRKVSDTEKQLSVTLQRGEQGRFKEYLSRKRPGETLTLRARVRPVPPAETKDDRFFQELKFALRLIDTANAPLPLRPTFAYFEDPEYNRRLSSQAAHASASLTIGGQQRTISLATDRRQYNPDGRLFLRYDWDAPVTAGHTVRLSLSRLDASGNTLELMPNDESEPDATKASIAVLKDDSIIRDEKPLNKEGELLTLALNKLRAKSNAEPVSLLPNDQLKLKLTVKPDGGQEKELTLTLPIVAEPVTPVPEAAYAFLRRNANGSVECVRFAWSPAASKIELVAPDDLKTEVVRRRAVFRWTDSVRPTVGVEGRPSGKTYGLQKITATGSTHFPEV